MTKWHKEKKVKPAKWRIYEIIYSRYPKIQEAYEERNNEGIWKAQKTLPYRVRRQLILKDGKEGLNMIQ